MTEETQPDNVVPIHQDPKNPWRITAVRYKQGQVMIEEGEGNKTVSNAFVLNIQFLDREPSKLITATEGDKGHKDFNIPIPVGIRADQLYTILMSAPEQIQAHLDGTAHTPDPDVA